MMEQCVWITEFTITVSMMVGVIVGLIVGAKIWRD